MATRGEAGTLAGKGGVPLFTAGLVAVAAAWFAFLLVSNRVVIDDAYISFRYLDNWLGGRGLVYNAGDRVEGYTNFLWIAALAPLRLMGLAPEAASFGLALAALTLLLWAVSSAAASLAGSRAAGILAVLLALSSGSLAFWTGSGMETVLFAALLALANASLARRGRLTVPAALLFGLAVLTRPDGVLFFAAAFLAFALPAAGGVPGGARGLFRAAAAFSVLPALQVLLRVWYYGEWLPNTFYAKATGIEADLLAPGLGYLADFLRSGGVVPLVAAAAVFLVRAGRSRTAVAVALQTVFQAAYTVKIGGDSFPLFRFLLPLLPGFAVLGGCALHGLLARAKKAERWWAPALVVPFALLAAHLDERTSQPGKIAVLRANGAEREAITSWIAAAHPAARSLAVNAAGLIPYRTGLVTTDMLGLTDRHIARVRVSAREEGTRFTGHFKHDGRYVLGRSPDIVLIGGATLWSGRDPKEVIRRAGRTAFTGDREFIAAAVEAGSYRVTADEVLPGEYAVALMKPELLGAGAGDARP